MEAPAKKDACRYHAETGPDFRKGNAGYWYQKGNKKLTFIVITRSTGLVVLTFWTGVAFFSDGAASERFEGGCTETDLRVTPLFNHCTALIRRIYKKYMRRHTFDQAFLSLPVSDRQLRYKTALFLPSERHLQLVARLSKWHILVLDSPSGKASTILPSLAFHPVHYWHSIYVHTAVPAQIFSLTQQSRI